jgi:flagellar biosynthesis/type III secretory pathway chaperone
MNDLLTTLIEALRDELQQYGEMLAMLDQQQSLVIQRQTHELAESVTGINTQLEHIAAARCAREQSQRDIARELKLPENASFKVIIPQLPPDYRPLVEALVQENNELLVRVQQRTRQNHLLLSHAVELMQQLLHSIFPSATPATYNGAGRLPFPPLPGPSFYEAIG